MPQHSASQCARPRDHDSGCYETRDNVASPTLATGLNRNGTVTIPVSLDQRDAVARDSCVLSSTCARGLNAPVACMRPAAAPALCLPPCSERAGGLGRGTRPFWRGRLWPRSPAGTPRHTTHERQERHFSWLLNPKRFFSLNRCRPGYCWPRGSHCIRVHPGGGRLKLPGRVYQHRMSI